MKNNVMVSAQVRFLHVATYFGGLLNGHIRDLRLLKFQTKIFIMLLATWGVVRCVVAQTSNQLPTGMAVLRYMLPEHVPSGCVSLQTSIDPDAYIYTGPAMCCCLITKNLKI